MGKPFPTIADAHEYLASLIEAGLGAHAIQVIVAPSKTVQAIAMASGEPADAKPALMIQTSVSPTRMPVSIVTVDNWPERAAPPPDTGRDTVTPRDTGGGER